MKIQGENEFMQTSVTLKRMDSNTDVAKVDLGKSY